MNQGAAKYIWMILDWKLTNANTRKKINAMGFEYKHRRIVFATFYHVKPQNNVINYWNIEKKWLPNGHWKKVRSS